MTNNPLVKIDFDIVSCCVCGIIFALPTLVNESLQNARRGEIYWCPNGHQQVYPKKEGGRK